MDALLAAVHVAVVLGFMFLWIPKRTVKWHRYLVVATAASWFGLGFFEGFGYCFLTDLEWRVKHARGVGRLPHSFIKYAVDWLSGRDVPSSWVDASAAAVFVAGSCAAIFRYLEMRQGRERSIRRSDR